jgi:outer membrane protein OmpA-like peptidoglycan-associated protein
MNAGVLAQRGAPRRAWVMMCLALGVADLVVVNTVVVPRLREGRGTRMVAAAVSSSPTTSTRTSSSTSTPTIQPIADTEARPPVALHFATGQAGLDGEARQMLAALSQELAEHPAWTLAIEGHTDARGDERLNKRLSLERARVVALRLRALGIAGGRLRVRGFGATRPLVDGDDEAALRLNRRVEIVIAREEP